MRPNLKCVTPSAVSNLLKYVMLQNFINRYSGQPCSHLYPEWLSWLGWTIGSLATAAYILSDIVEHRKKIPRQSRGDKP